MYTPYIPAKDADFDNWLQNFSALLTASPTTYGLTAPNAVTVAAQYTAWHAAYVLATDPPTRTAGTVAAKDAARASASAVVRPFAVTISRNQAVSNEAKADIGVTVPDPTRTPIPPPVTAPSLILSSIAPGVLNLQYRDSSDPTARKKPFGVLGLELYASIGTTAATDPAQCDFVGTYTKTPFQFETGPTGGKIVTLFARWVNRSGAGARAATGPWSLPLVTYSA